MAGMGESPKSYYQVSFTGTQALVALLVFLGALTFSFFLGAKAGFTRTKAAAHPAQAAAPAVEPPASSAAEAPPASTSSPGPAPAATASTAASSTAPIVAPTFEDREAGLPEETAPPSSEIRTSETPPSRTVIAGSTSSPPKTQTKAPPATATHAPAKAETREAAKPARFYVQVLSTSSRSEAGRWKDRLGAKKYKAAVSSVETKKGKLFRVRVGPYADKEQAKKIAAKISSEEKRQAWVAPAE